MYTFAATSLLLILAIAIQHQRGVRNRRIVKAFEKIRWTYIDLQHLASLLNDPQISAEKIQQQCEVVVDKIAKALSEVAGANCSACIKLVENDFGSQDGTPVRPRVTTLCRDDSSRHRDLAASAVDHWIDQNTAFKKLFENLGTASPDYYFCNDLTKEKNYENTSIPQKWKPQDSHIPLLRNHYRRKKWPLPYRSTVVFRIAGVAPNSGDHRATICGFLCADSKGTGIFDKDHDLEILKSIAGCLYQSVQRYSTIQTETKSRREKHESAGQQ
ncbi:MAG: hypothetical protein ACJ71U_15510 [Terriglobales bacterium]